MKKRFLFLLVVFFALITLFTGCKEPEASGDGTITVIVVDSDKTELFEGELVFNEGDSLVDLLKNHEEIKLGGSDSEYGFYIESVCGKNASDAGATFYWNLKINGEDSMVGISSVVIEDEMEVKLSLVDWTVTE